MDLLFWRKNKKIDVFATDIAEELYSNIQPDVAKSYFEEKKSGKKKKNIKKDKKLQQKIDGAINELISKVNYFREVNSLGVYGKARLHLTFSERLKELGYDADLAKQINDILLVKTP